MVKFYLMMIQRGAITIENVPIKWREDVAKFLGNKRGDTA